MVINILNDKCVGCGLCVKACPFAAITIVDKLAVVNEACNLCGACVDSCSFAAIEMPVRAEVSDPTFDDHRGVWVFAQVHDGEVHHVTLELMGEGRILAEKLGTELCCMVMGEATAPIVEELSHYDVDRIFTVESPVLASFRTQPYVTSAASLINEHKPEIVLIGATTTGRDFAGALATELKAGLTADCTGLEIEVETRSLLQTRPAFGGNIMATIKSSNHRPQMATVRPKVFAQPERGDAQDVTVIAHAVELNEDDQKTRILEWMPAEESVSLADANIIVSGGRGIGGKENVHLLRELAELMDGAVGASRAVVDAGWIDYPHQVGQTGRTVRPKLYVAVGISGAVQHLAGMKTSDVIIAINRDREAPIFSVATHGFVGDVTELLPRVISGLKKRLGDL